MISKDIEMQMINSVMTIVLDSGHKVNEYEISHHVRSKVGGGGDSDELTITIRYDGNNEDNEGRQ